MHKKCKSKMQKKNATVNSEKRIISIQTIGKRNLPDAHIYVYLCLERAYELFNSLQYIQNIIDPYLMPFFKRLFFAPPQKFTRHAMIALSGLSSLLYTFSSVICQVSVKIFIFRAETNNAVREIEIYINSCATHAQKICKRLSDHDYVLPSCKSHFSKHKLSPKTKGPRGEFNGILPKTFNNLAFFSIKLIKTVTGISVRWFCEKN